MSETATPASSPAPRRRRRWPWIVAGTLLVIVVVAALVVPSLLDVERYRGAIERSLRESTGWEPELGAIGFSVVRGLVLTVEPAALRDPQGRSQIEIGSLEVRAELRPLLERRLEIRSIELRRPQIALVRPDDKTGWVLPRAAARQETARTGGAGSADPAPGTAAAPARGGLAVSIDEVRLSGGALRLEDRTTRPPTVLALDQVGGVVQPARGQLDVAGQLADGGGGVAVRGSWAQGLAVQLDAVKTQALAALLGPDLLREGGTLSGTLDVRLPAVVEGKLNARNLLLLAGDRPLERAELSFRARSEQDRWLLDSLGLGSGGVTLSGRGALTPDLALTLEIPQAPLEAVTGAARAVFPLELALEPPGAAGATIDVRKPAGRDLTYSARGRVSAAGFRVADFLPPARDLETTFALSPRGALEIRVERGTAASGPLDGVIRIDSIQPLGRLTFDGRLTDALLGQLLEGFVSGSAEKIRGPAALQAGVRLDLAKGTDVSALGGKLELSANDVRIPGWDLEGAIRRSIDEKLSKLGALAAALGKTPADAGSKAAKVVEEVLESISAEVDFNTQPWTLTRLGLQAGGVAAVGGGTFDAVQGRVNLECTATLSESKTAELIRKASAVDLLVARDGRLTLPLRIKGPLMKPEIGVDADQVLKNKLPEEKPKDRAKELLKGLVNKKLSGDKR